MTTELFFKWLLRFSSYVRLLKSSRKVSLFIDNLLAHGSQGDLSELDNVTVVFRPPDNTSKLQPRDAGILASINTRYGTVQYDFALERAEAAQKQLQCRPLPCNAVDATGLE